MVTLDPLFQVACVLHEFPASVFVTRAEGSVYFPIALHPQESSDEGCMETFRETDGSSPSQQQQHMWSGLLKKIASKLLLQPSGLHSW